jgi:hypothetical protein
MRFMEVIFLCPFLCVFCAGVFCPMCVYVGARAFCALPPFCCPPPPPPPLGPPVSADGITDTSLGSLTIYARNVLASWQAEAATRLLARPTRRCSPC